MTAQDPPPLTKGVALEIQEKLIAAFDTGDFRKKLDWIISQQNVAWEEKSKQRQELCLDAQRAILPEYGFEGSYRGVQKCTRYFASGLQKSDPEVCNQGLLLVWLQRRHEMVWGLACMRSCPTGPYPPGGYRVVPTEASDAAAIRGIERCRAALVKAHLSLYESTYPDVRPDDWLEVLGKQSVVKSLETGITILQAECADTGKVAGYVSYSVEAAPTDVGPCEDEQESLRRQRPFMKIHHIAVDPEHKMHGVGRQLFEGLLARLRDPSSASVVGGGGAGGAFRNSLVIELSVVEQNHSAVAWYRRLGFSVVRTERGYLNQLSGKQATVGFLVMRRRLDAASPEPPWGPLFGSEICCERVVVLPPQSPPDFVAFVEMRPPEEFAKLLPSHVSAFDEKTGKHRLADGRILDISEEFSAGRLYFERPLHELKEPRWSSG